MDAENFFLLLSGICWSIVYIEIIRLGFKYKTYGMPLFALALNIAWEFIYGFLGFTPGGSQKIVNIIWCTLDIVIVFTFFKYGFKLFPKGFSKQKFIAWGVLVLAVAFILQLLFFFQFPEKTAKHSYGEPFSAFLQNVIMSILFIQMLVTRSNTNGQSMTIAIAKWIGTICATLGIWYSVSNHDEIFNDPSFPNWTLFFCALGVFCFIFDVIYIILLRQRKQLEKAD